ncbi:MULTISPECIES: hypothetical protein [unclassified Bradyrhizobium]|uniref:hypothetical protein n=1 Tax=unclassified Bradyrhizobium TaxID=2631580 RepID=UPI0028EEBF94|nr:MULTISPECIES: hypothetical protein [unclassified Bradyrhizobium]
MLERVVVGDRFPDRLLGWLLGPRPRRVRAVQQLAGNGAQSGGLQRGHLECVASGEVILREVVIEQAERLFEVAPKVVVQIFEATRSGGEIEAECMLELDTLRSRCVMPFMRSSAVTMIIVYCSLTLGMVRAAPA